MSIRNTLIRAFHAARWRRFDPSETDWPDTAVPLTEEVIEDFLDTNVGIAYVDTLPLENQT